ncbi:ribosome biogenesis GTP-binding protein YihA/YsxC [Pelagibius sp. Alg239-R121]|uniref:ribosome biogenesis GTP-binding protein YihA/YsxC n=1 Tax=Pelagibius sp. Alg239-R121 TaxID=2993448 RepID=UPI0024A721CA|nr:ribosome biogenesis GTP-binding protein YihA/YsxC [Pelagibius sp. Alg239-R121]
MAKNLEPSSPPGPDTGDEAARQQALETGRLLFAKECQFLTAAAQDGQLPDLGLPEIAFAGRSNVGKSSLVNALTGRKTLARTSHTPGRTQQLNFFGLGGRLVMVDLPGYGYARAAKTDVKRWTGVTRNYLKGRTELRRVCLLIDSRHGLKDNDREIMAELDVAAVSYQVVLTKTDKLKPTGLATVLKAVETELAKHPAAHPEVAVTSSHKTKGIAELRAALATLAEPAPER